MKEFEQFRGEAPPWGHKLTPSAFSKLIESLKPDKADFQSIFEAFNGARASIKLALVTEYHNTVSGLDNRLSFMKTCHACNISLVEQKEIVKQFQDKTWATGIWS